MDANIPIDSNDELIPESMRDQAVAFLDSLKQLPESVYQYITNNPRKATFIVLGTMIVCVVCGGVYVLYMNPAYISATQEGIFSCSRAIATSISNGWSFLKELAIVNPYKASVLGVAVVVTPPICCLFQTWRKQQADVISSKLLSNTQEMALRIHNDEVLSNYSCPLALVPSNNPVRVQEGKLVWYFDQELLRSWYDHCRSKGRTPYNPLTMQPLPFDSGEAIIVDEEARRVITERMIELSRY